ncbi:hypothetical protein DVH24_038958 [Malus domestica]|uniref:Uncharacterized protein n=1 Tax=Malus domestica TaxID=3750 RepID=A0A498KE67_MALDO|nr:hypothetical protein DVH24_038958 [Malus domestica]
MASLRGASLGEAGQRLDERSRLHRSTILSALGLGHALTVLFLRTHTRTSQWVTHDGECSRPNLLNFGVPIEPEASEFSKSLVLYGCGHHDIVRFGPWPHPHGFVSGNSDENFLVGHSSWYYSCPNSLNFGVSMEPEASEFPKGLVLYGGGHVHIRHITHSPLVDMGCYIN